jgi:hypothetical protein
MSRILEKFVTNRWLQPAIAAAVLIANQFAFRHTESATCAPCYSYAGKQFFRTLLLVDFSKAFDCVDHVVLV